MMRPFLNSPHYSFKFNDPFFRVIVVIAKQSNVIARRRSRRGNPVIIQKDLLDCFALLAKTAKTSGLPCFLPRFARGRNDGLGK
ncbi:MAG: hypothetical protein Q7U78_08105 [Gallionella sp.]|nr:hypothetical protein [Gallionella sp.]